MNEGTISHSLIHEVMKEIFYVYLFPGHSETISKQHNSGKNKKYRRQINLVIIIRDYYRNRNTLDL